MTSPQTDAVRELVPLLFVLVATALTWMHFAIRHMEAKAAPELGRLPELPEMAGLQPSMPPRTERPAPGRPLHAAE